MFSVLIYREVDRLEIVEILQQPYAYYLFNRLLHRLRPWIKFFERRKKDVLCWTLICRQCVVKCDIPVSYSRQITEIYLIIIEIV